MKLLSRSALVAVIGILAAVPGIAYAGYALASRGAGGIAAWGDRPSSLWATSPDSNASGVALGGSLTIAALLSGGTLLVRQRWLAQAAAADAATLEAEVDLSRTTETETVLVVEPAEIESEVALAYRR